MHIPLAKAGMHLASAVSRVGIGTGTNGSFYGFNGVFGNPIARVSPIVRLQDAMAGFFIDCQARKSTRRTFDNL
jgi:hypothetical protein